MSEEDIPEVGWIDDSDYRSAVEELPIHCVDIIVDYGEEGVLLGKRTNEPFKNEWWFPGGRQRKGERMEETARRLAEEELEIEAEVSAQIETYDLMSSVSEFGDDVPKHTPATVYRVEPLGEEYEPGEQHSDLEVFDRLPKDPHWYIEEVLYEATGYGIEISLKFRS